MTDYPIGVTVSFTIFVEGNDEDDALLKAQNMTTEEILSQVSANPSIEFENVEF